VEVAFDGRNIPLCFPSTETISKSINPYGLTAQKYSKWVHQCTPHKRPLLQNFNPTRAIVHQIIHQIKFSGIESWEEWLPCPFMVMEVEQSNQHRWFVESNCKSATTT
jgi:hypothetical protein